MSAVAVALAGVFLSIPTAIDSALVEEGTVVLAAIKQDTKAPTQPDNPEHQTLGAVEGERVDTIPVILLLVVLVVLV
jgi:hypothetical protein